MSILMEGPNETITPEQLSVEVSNAGLFWQGLPVDLDQEAKVTFTQIGKSANEQISNRQKPRSNGVWGEGTIQVMYDVPNGHIQVWKYDLEKGWVQQGKDVPVKFADGDQFSAISRKDGMVEIYRNGKLLATRKIAATVSLLAHDNGVFKLTSYRPSASELSIPNLPPLLPLSLPLQQTTSLTIDYTYDPLNRLTSATYSDGRSFGYTYDAAGNVLELGQNLGPGTVTTAYTYNTANELITAQVDSTTWNYTYDANGSLTEVLPNGNPEDGAKRYTYNAAGNLVQVEAHNGSAWDVQAEMDYNGLGQRLSMDAAGVIAHYVMDGNRPLVSDSAGNTTFFLYGRGIIGEKTTDWNFSLPDGTNTPRQLTDDSGGITLTTRYTPWGDTLEIYGTGNFTFGYIGSILDTATGLLYVGNGQYYDPSTGRFLTRGVNPDSSNPYVPWNPIGAIIGPLALFSLAARRRKSKANPYLLMVMMLVVLPLSVGLACGTTQTEEPAQTVQSPVAETQTVEPITVSPATPAPTQPATEVGPCDGCPSTTPTPTPTPTPISSYADALLGYGVRLLNGSDDFNGTWNQRLAFNAWRAVSDISNKLGGPANFRDSYHTYSEDLVLKKVGTYVEYFSDGSTVEHDNGAITRGTHLVEFADIDYYADDSIRNNIVHELGHVYNNNQGDPASSMPYNFVTDRNKFLRQVGDDHVMWQLHPPAEGVSSNTSETFADMFVAHIYGAWVTPEKMQPNPQLWMQGVVK